MSDITSPRRYYLVKRITSWRAGDCAISDVFRSLQEAEPGGTEWPTGFPGKAQLEAAGYVAKNDLDGADECELADYAQLSSRVATAAIAAAAAL